MRVIIPTSLCSKVLTMTVILEWIKWSRSKEVTCGGPTSTMTLKRLVKNVDPVRKFVIHHLRPHYTPGCYLLTLGWESMSTLLDHFWIESSWWSLMLTLNGQKLLKWVLDLLGSLQPKQWKSYEESKPPTAISDNGPQFMSQPFAEFLKINGIRHFRSAQYHPATNGQVECFV